MRVKGLQAWIDYIGSLSVREIDLSLARVRVVAERMGLLDLDCVVITVGGTNGKGSTVAGLEAIYRAADYQVGAFTSPFLLRLNEEFRLNGKEVTDENLCDAFLAIEEARGQEHLTPFEFKTLAAFYLFKQADVDVMLLEVGLGGRLDAVNVQDADLAVITSIGIDHVEYLGNTRELIAKEKAGIFREGRPVVCGDTEPPQALLKCAAELSAPFYYRGRDFGFKKEKESWTWQSEKLQIKRLSLPSLALENMTTVLKVVELMQDKLPVTHQAIADGIQQVRLPGRLQVFPGEVTRIFDVSHNPASAEFLKKSLQTQPHPGKTRAVFSMLADKDMIETVKVIQAFVDEWYIAPLTVKRAASLEKLKEACDRGGAINVNPFSDIVEAYQAAMQTSQKGDRIIIFGSFHTVAEVMRTSICHAS